MSDLASFRALRDRIRRASDALDQSDAAVAPEDRGAVGRARKFAAAMGAIRPSPPPALASPEFLQQVYDRAARASASAIGPSLLRRGFAPAIATRDIVWVEPSPMPELAEFLRAGLPRSSGRVVPIATGQARRVRHSRLRWPIAMAAAMLVGVGAFMAFRGTSMSLEPVFEVADAPLSADHPSDFLRGLVERQALEAAPLPSLSFPR